MSKTIAKLFDPDPAVVLKALKRKDVDPNVWCCDDNGMGEQFLTPLHVAEDPEVVQAREVANLAKGATAIRANAAPGKPKSSPRKRMT